MKTSLITLLALIPMAMQAGSPPPPPEVTPPPAAASEWEVTVTPYGWLASIDGTLTARGYSASTSIGLDDIMANLDMVAMMNIEARKGRFGGWVDGIYMKISSDADTPGPLLDSLGISVESLIAEGALFYRVWESDRGYLDLYGGARYVRMGTDLHLNVDTAGVRDVSEELSAKVVDTLIDSVRGKAAPALSKAGRQAATKAQEVLADTVAQKVQQVETKLDQLRAIADAHPKLVNILRNSDRVKQAIRAAAEVRAAEELAELEAKTAQAKAATAAVRQEIARTKARVRKAVQRAEKQLAKEIERALHDALPEEISQTADWVDPFVGMRAFYNFTDRLYAVAKADIGGFGVGSDLTWQAYGALGWRFNKHVSTEIGYRHMDIDYSSDKGFAADMTMSGAQVALCIRF